MLARVRSPRRLRGEVRLPGDKSISHRALMLNAVASGRATVSGLSAGADVAATASCLRALGVGIEGDSVAGHGFTGLRPPAAALDCANSGTTMRLLAGLLAGLPFEVELVGDPSLARRPMERVVEPLRRMGAHAATSPLRVGGGSETLRGIEHVSPVASAQVKSALLMAGLQATGTTRVREAARSRDHTERMLRAMGAAVRSQGLEVALDGPAAPLRPLDLQVPGDLSAAAFWLVAATLHPRARVKVVEVGVNPTRTAALEALARLGGRVERGREHLAGDEPVADLEAGTAAGLRPFEIGGAEVAGLIDELPVLAVAAAVVPGISRVTGAAELRVKESDRIATMARGLRAMGAQVQELADGWQISGPARLEGARVDCAGDHRVAMALAVAGLLAAGETEIEGAESVDISYPGFWDQLERLCSP
ncbi:MAG: 3-phosphoshikimate 1-carboxyvinyltransferase [Candidatus Dormibacteraeota bacterium]|nr:3-phosphoshikimate 1-carboxyvinyltransferase [Candidatus Dormibacteraeota bacterium]